MMSLCFDVLPAPLPFSNSHPPASAAYVFLPVQRVHQGPSCSQSVACPAISPWRLS